MITLSNRFIVSAVAKTSTRLFKDLIVGDIVEISVVLERKTNRRGNYATFYTVENLSIMGAKEEFSSTVLYELEMKGFKLDRIDYKS